MKTLHVLALAAFATASLAGCGSKSFCETQKETFDTALTKVANCPTMKAGMSAGRPADSTCEAAYKNCSSADKLILDDMVACLDKLPTCTADTELDTWAPAAMACQNKASSLSVECVGITKP